MELKITLDESWKAFIDAEIAGGMHESAADYIHWLLMQAKLRKHRDKIEALLEEGLTSGEPREWTKETVEEIKRRVHEQPAEQGGKVL
jgi:putative addiction module CopG family antidote